MGFLVNSIWDTSEYFKIKKNISQVATFFIDSIDVQQKNIVEFHRETGHLVATKLLKHNFKHLANFSFCTD